MYGDVKDGEDEEEGRLDTAMKVDGAVVGKERGAEVNEPSHILKNLIEQTMHAITITRSCSFC